MNAVCGFQTRFRSSSPVPLPISTPPRKKPCDLRASDDCLQQLHMERSSVYPAGIGGSSGNAVLSSCFHFNKFPNNKRTFLYDGAINQRQGLNGVHTHLRVAQILLHPIADVKNFRRRRRRWRRTRNGHQKRLARRL